MLAPCGKESLLVNTISVCWCVYYVILYELNINNIIYIYIYVNIYSSLFNYFILF